MFLISQSASGLGDAVRFIALTALLVQISGSGLSAALGLVFSIVPSLVLSLFAGSVGDLLPEKTLLISLELVRSAVLMMFINCAEIPLIYGLQMILSSLDAIFNPPLRKIMANLLGEKILRGNAIFNGVSGMTNIFGSLLSAVIISRWNIKAALLTSCYLHAISAVFLLFTRTGGRHQKAPGGEKKAHTSVCSNIKNGVMYIKAKKQIREIIMANTVLCFGAVATTMAFYPYAFDVLKMTQKEWGLLMSIFYGANFIAMLLSPGLQENFKRKGLFSTYLIFIFISGIWLLYGSLETAAPVFILQLLEGSAVALCGIFLVTMQQSITERRYLATTTGISDFIASIGKTVGLGYAYTAMSLWSVRHVFVINAAVLSLYAVYKISLLLNHRGSAAIRSKSH
jgi:hypothetical protein